MEAYMDLHDGEVNVQWVVEYHAQIIGRDRYLFGVQSPQLYRVVRVTRQSLPCLWC